MADSQKGEWRQEFYDLIQSFTRSMVFGIALLYTLETWAIGSLLPYWKLIGFFALSVLADFYLIPLTSGQKDLSFLQVIHKTARNKGMSIISSTLILWTMDIISPLEFPYERDVATVMLLSIPVSIGADVANILKIFQGRKEAEEEDGGQEMPRNPWKFLRNDIASTSAGALFVCLPIAPTEEIPVLATRLTYWQEIMMVLLSLALSYVIVFTSGMTQIPPSGPDTRAAAIWPFAETLVSYAISLLVALLMLALFGQVTFQSTLGMALSLTIVLGLPAAIGGAAGRLVL